MQIISLPIKLFFLTLVFLCLQIHLQAQGPNHEYEFQYYGQFPHPFWYCPSCSDIPGGGSQPETKIAYGMIDYRVVQGSGIIYNLDKNLSATLTGGRLMGGNYEDSTCEYGQFGYGTIGFSELYGNFSCSNASNKITVTFSQPVRGKQLKLRGRYPQRLIITEGGRPPVSVDLYRTFENGQPTNKGYVDVFLSQKKITSLTVESLDPQFSFSIGSIIAMKALGSSNPSGSLPSPNYCNVTPRSRPVPQIINSHDWSMNAEVTDRDGLVLTDIRLKGRKMAERISIPYYQVQTKQGSTLSSLQRGELRPGDTSGNMRSRLVSYEPAILSDRFVIKATYAIDQFSPGQSCLTVTQVYEFLRQGVGGICTPPGPFGIGYNLPCQRWRAYVTHDFKSNGGESLEAINIVQRNHFKVNDVAQNTVGLFKDCDDNSECIIGYGGIVFKNKINPLLSETFVPVIVNGNQTMNGDNFHQTYLGRVSEPLENYFSRFTAAGCPECVHSHWRWGAQHGEQFGSGNLFIPQGSMQYLSVAVLKFRSGEEHPNNFSDLISYPESIRSRVSRHSNIDRLMVDTVSETIPQEVVYWMSATTTQMTSDRYFGHYGFFITDEPNVQRPISSNNLLRRNTAADNGKTASLTGGDSPTSILFGHLFLDGATTYTERDPASIAPLPNGYAQYNNISYDVRTEASASGPHTITFNLPSVTDQTTFHSLRILHSEPDRFNPTQARWVDRTILLPAAPSPDFANRNISAKVNEVGPFVVARLVNPPAPNTNAANLAVSVTESADPVTAGNNLVYTINVTNNGPDMATGVALSSGLSPDVQFISADAGIRTCTEINGTVVCDLDSIASSATLTATITVKPDEGQIRFPAEGKSIFHSVFVTGNESDPDETNNEVTISTNALPNPNAPPTAKIQSPAKEAIFAGPASFEVIIDAKDTDGTIAQTELFLDGVSIGTGTSVDTDKFQVNLTNVVYGEHKLTAVSTDNGGRKAVSETTRFFVNGPVKISLDSPNDGTLLPFPTTIALTATGVNQSGTISQVEFFADGQSIGLGTLSGTNQFSFNWNNAVIGPHTLRAIATDGNGVKSWSESATVFISLAPTVNITAPSTGATVPKYTAVTFTATATDSDGYVSSVEFLVNGTGSFGLATLTQDNVFSLTWSGGNPGTYSISAKATDDTGLVTVSSPINLIVTNTPPTVSITAPANGATFTAPASISLSANAADSDGSVSKVEFYRGTTLLSTILSPPYNFSWTNVAAGSYSLTAKATDDNNAVTTSSPVAITVNTPPTALFVVGNTTLSSVDTAIKTRLQNLGLTVVVKSASSAVAADATGKRVVVISDSVTATSVNTKFRTVTVPVVTLSSQLFDDMGMTPTATTNFGTTTAQKNVTITNASHPMAGGLSGTVQVTSANATFGWGKPNTNAAKIATLTTDSTKATDFGYASGAVMPGLTAPARRVGFFYTASSATLTTNGGVLFDNAIRWAAGL